MLRLNNLSIGTKLMITSGLGVALMAGMIATMMIGNKTVRSAVDEATTQASITQLATDLRGASRAMQIGLRDMRLSLSLDGSKKAMEYFHARQRTANQAIENLMQAVKAADQEWIKKAKALSDRYVSEGDKIGEMNEQIFTLQAQRMGATTTEARDLTERIGDLDSEANRLMRESAAPIANEIE